MLLPIYAYGQPVLKQVGKDIDATYPDLAKLIENMWQTMYDASGVGLAAPQVGLSIRLFVVDTIQIEDEERKPNFKGFKKVFINAQILEESGKEWGYEEGCLSIPNVRGEVMRKENLTIRYQDENFVEHTESFAGVNARVIQHEYDHIEGLLFTEKLNPVKRNLIRPKLDNIRRGKVKDVDYKMKFINLK
jgi:peptide deformylase